MLKLQQSQQERETELLRKINNQDQGGMLLELAETLGSQAQSIFKEVKEIKRIEAGRPPAPERRDGDIVEEEEVEETVAGGNGKKESARMKILDRIIETPHFQEILEEWAFHVKRGQDATMFANMFLGQMRDPNPECAETRKGGEMFANYMMPREWDEMRVKLDPQVDKDTLKVFDTAHAKAFFDAFRLIVYESLQESDDELMQRAQEKRELRAAEREKIERAKAEKDQKKEPEKEKEPVATK